MWLLLIADDHAIRFDGINDHIIISDHPDFDLTSSYTLEAWIFPESFSWLSGIISKYHTNGSNGYMLRLSQNAPYNGIGFDALPKLILESKSFSGNELAKLAGSKEIPEIDSNYNDFDDLDNETLVEKIKALLENMDIDIAWQAVLRLTK